MPTKRSQAGKHWYGLITLGVLVISSARAFTAPLYTVSFDDPGSTFSTYYSEIQNSILAAGADWNRYLDGSNSASIDIQVQFSSTISTADATPTTQLVGTVRGLNLFEMGPAYELRTSTDPSGAAPDALIRIGTTYLANELWFDPDPFTRTAPVPSGKTDAESVLLHELGHIFGFDGFLDQTTGQPLNNNISTYDQYVINDGGNLFFTGPDAEAVYGGPVPLTFGNYTHVGNLLPRPGSDLIADLMNGVEFNRGYRYDISPLDLTILADTGLPISVIAAVPEPSSLLLLSCGLVIIFVAGMTLGQDIDILGKHIKRNMS